MHLRYEGEVRSVGVGHRPDAAIRCNAAQHVAAQYELATRSNRLKTRRADAAADGPSERDIVRMQLQLRSGVVPLGRRPAVALAERRVGILQPYSERVPEKR